MIDPFEKAYQELKYSLMPKEECKTCECGEMRLSMEHMGWEYVCELEECYHTLEESTNES